MSGRLPAPPLPERPLFLVDYDGTLAPLVTDPACAWPHPQAVSVLAGLAQSGVPVYVVSGRRLDDLALRLPVPALGLVGVHGLEERFGGRERRLRVPAQARRALEQVRRHLPRLPGVRLEDKGLSLALHYRGCPDEAAVEEELRRWAARLPEPLQPLWGKKVLEVRPRGRGKGETAARLARRHRQRIPVCLGDDATDEEAFSALAPPAITIKVGEGPTRARYRLAGVDAAVGYLAACLLALCPPDGG